MFYLNVNFGLLHVQGFINSVYFTIHLRCLPVCCGMCHGADRGCGLRKSTEWNGHRQVRKIKLCN